MWAALRDREGYWWQPRAQHSRSVAIMPWKCVWRKNRGGKCKWRKTRLLELARARIHEGAGAVVSEKCNSTAGGIREEIHWLLSPAPPHLLPVPPIGWTLGGSKRHCNLSNALRSPSGQGGGQRWEGVDVGWGVGQRWKTPGCVDAQHNMLESVFMGKTL